MRTRNLDFPVSRNLRLSLPVLIAVCSFMLACSAEKKPIAEAVPAATPTPAEQSQQLAKLPPPQINEAQEAVKRVFKEMVVIDISHKPAFVAADFNGDLSEDLAVVVKPASDKIPELNEEFPPWILRDPFETTEPRSPRLRIADKEQLLAVIHGYGPKGWRDPQATQTFLLKNVVGSDMRVQELKEFTAANQDKTLPRLRGAVVGEVLDGKSGYLYYAGATYSWYDPKDFKGEPERGMVHGRPREAARK